jgi:S-adenosylmethionine synthetase
MVFGEVSTKAEVNFEQIARQAIKEIGYDSL